MLLLKKMTSLVSFIVMAGFVICGSVSMAAETPAQGAQAGAAPAHIKAYYFHGNFRCGACSRIQEFSEKSIQKYFEDQLKDGTLVYKAVNIDEPENRHFIKDYQLYTRSLVIAADKNGKEVKWKNLDRVWQLVRNETRFGEYVKTEIEQLYKEL